MECDHKANDMSEALPNEPQESSNGKSKELGNRKEISKPLNTIKEERQNEARYDSLDEQEAVEDDKDEGDILLAASENKASFVINGDIPKIMISKERIAV